MSLAALLTRVSGGTFRTFRRCITLRTGSSNIVVPQFWIWTITESRTNPLPGPHGDEIDSTTAVSFLDPHPCSVSYKIHRAGAN